MTQSALAQAVGCKQSAVSMLESGQPEKLSKETAEKIAKLLGVDLDAPAENATPDSRPPAPNPLSGYCPNAACPSNVPYAVQGELFFWPRLQPLARGGHCVACGELLEPRCPHCGAPVTTDGGCCPACGGARVANTLPPATDADDWSARRCREIAEWRARLT
jgi:transcriptional regulator with XRE-family HTH domain